MLNSETQSSGDPILLVQKETDALLQAVNEQITLHTFDPHNHHLLKRMVESMGDSRGMVRLGFAQALGEVGEPATPFLLEALADHPNPVVRRAAAKTLTIIADPKAIPTLLDALFNDEDTVVKGSAVAALASTGEAAVPALLEILASPVHPESTKGHAAWALAFIGSEAAEHLYAAMDSDSADVRCAVVGAIAKVTQEQADERAYNLLLSALTDSAAEVRTEAAAAFSELTYPPAVPHLIQALRDADGEVRKAAVSSLGKIGDRTALEPLRVTLTDELGVVRQLAKLAISQIENQSSVRKSCE